MNDTVKWLLLGGAAYLVWYEFSQGTGGVGTASPTTGTGAGTGAGTGSGSGATSGTTVGSGITSSPPAQQPQTAVVNPILAGPVSLVQHNALQAAFNINGTIETIAVIPGGDAWNTTGQIITPALAQLGITPEQLYNIMQAAYIAPHPSGTPARGVMPSRGGSDNTAQIASLITDFNGLVAGYNAAPPMGKPPIQAAMIAIAQQIRSLGGQVPSNPLGLSGYGLGAISAGPVVPLHQDGRGRWLM